MRALLILLATGCHIGGGPVIAFSRGGVRLGAEASGGLGPFRGSAGGTGSVTGAEPKRMYITADPGFGLPLTDESGDGYEALGFVGLTVGYSSNEGFGDHFALGAWGAAVVANDDCSDSTTAFSVAVGLRTLGDLTEVFIAPKINTLELWCDI